jgi:hypothetical protein
MARARNIGNVYAELSVKDKMTVGMKRAERGLTAFGKKIASIGVGMAAALPAAAFAGVVASMKSAIDAGGKLSDMMARTGADGEKLFVMQRAFENAGIAGGKVPAVLNKMQKALAGVNEEGKRVQSRVFSDLGLNVMELQGMDAAAAFEKMAGAFAKIPDPAKRAALAMELFGRSGGELLVLMNDGKAFEVAAQQVGGLGKTLADNAEKLDKISDSMKTLGVKAQQVGAEIAVELLPALEGIADTLNAMDFSGATRDAIKFVKAMEPLADIGKRLGGVEVFKSIYKGVAWNAKTETLEIKLSKSHPMAGEFKEGIPPLSEYNPGVMLPPAWEMIDFTREIPELLKRQPELTRGLSWDATGIPGMTDMMDAITRAVMMPYDDPEQVRERERTEVWESVSAEVNSMQARGLGMGAMHVPKEAKDQVSLLQQIRDVLKQARADGDMIFA